MGGKLVKMNDKKRLKQYGIFVDNRLFKRISAYTKSDAKAKIPYDSWLHGTKYKIKEVEDGL